MLIKTRRRGVQHSLIVPDNPAKNEEFYVKNEELCVENEGVCIKA